MMRRLWDYYKLHMVVAAFLLYFLGSMVYRAVTYRDVLLYVAAVNITESDKLTFALRDHFSDYIDMDSAKEKIELYSKLYLTTDVNSENYGYSYASEMKIVGSIEAKQLDVVLMDKEAFDAFSANGYLMDLHIFLFANAPSFLQAHDDDIVKNTVVLEDNAEEVRLDKNVSYEAVTEEVPNGILLSDSAFAKHLGFSAPVYLGVLQNTEHGEMAAKYVEYLFEDVFEK